MNSIFSFFILSGIVVAILGGRADIILNVATNSATSAVERAIVLLGIMSFWLGIAKVAERSGLIEIISRFIAPIFSWLFPSIPQGHPALGCILMNLGANVLGFGNAATPFGLKAMRELQKINPNPDAASEAMCTFLAINTSSVTLVPATLIAMRASYGSKDPSEVISAIIFATFCSTMAAILADLVARKISKKRI